MTDESPRPQSLTEARHRRPRAAEQGRVPPQNLEAEGCVIGAMLHSREAVQGAISAGLTLASFAWPFHGHAYSAITSVAAEDGSGVDLVTVGDEMARQGTLGDEGREQLRALFANTPHIGHSARYVEIVARHARERDVIAAGHRIIDAGHRGDLEFVSAQVDDLAMVVSTADDGEASSWNPVDLESLDDEPTVVPTLLPRTDGVCLLYPGKVHSFNAEAESYKSWLAMWAAVEVVEAGRHVIYVDWEDSPATARQRLRELGADWDEVRERFHYLRPDSPVNAASAARVRAMCRTWDVGLMVVDGVGAAMSASGWNEDKDADTQAFYRLLPRLASREGCVVVLVDHVVKDPEARRGHASGSHAKKDLADVCFEMTVVEPGGRGRSGKVRILVTKDRPGSLRGEAVGGKWLANLSVDSTNNGDCVAMVLRPPERTGLVALRPTVLMARISYQLMMAGGPLTKRAVREAVRGKTPAKDRALAVLCEEGYAQSTQAGYVHVRPYREDDDSDGQEHERDQDAF